MLAFSRIHVLSKGRKKVTTNNQSYVRLVQRRPCTVLLFGARPIPGRRCKHVLPAAPPLQPAASAPTSTVFDVTDTFGFSSTAATELGDTKSVLEPQTHNNKNNRCCPTTANYRRLRSAHAAAVRQAEEGRQAAAAAARSGDGSSSNIVAKTNAVDGRRRRKRQWRQPNAAAAAAEPRAKETITR